MKLSPTGIKEVIIVEPNVHRDLRGQFFESYREDILLKNGISTKFVQENVSKSNRNVLRGLHYQLKRPQAKLCWVPYGAALDVAVDIRKGSPTFGGHVAVHLSSENFRMLYVPKGFAHGVLLLVENTIFQYKCDDYYVAEDGKGIAWDDPDLKIDWGVKRPILSKSDQGLPNLRDMREKELPCYHG